MGGHGWGGSGVTAVVGGGGGGGCVGWAAGNGPHTTQWRRRVGPLASAGPCGPGPPQALIKCIQLAVWTANARPLGEATLKLGVAMGFGIHQGGVPLAVCFRLTLVRDTSPGPPLTPPRHGLQFTGPSSAGQTSGVGRTATPWTPTTTRVARERPTHNGIRGAYSNVQRMVFNFE
jgi:hypothetical protein